MARLTLPGVGTVVHVEGDLEQSLLAAGWVAVAGESDEKPGRKRPSKSGSGEK